MPRARLIIGGGLLGRAIHRASSDPTSVAVVRWHDGDLAVSDLTQALTRFVELPGRLEVYWCAGRGVTATPASELAEEVQVFRRFLAELGKLPEHARARISVFLASSVGGAYAGAAHPPFSEDTPPAPLSAYGSAKLEMEGALRSTTDSAGLRAFISRLTNIYGPGQDLTKAQGLISVLIDGEVSGRPVNVYVPLDTLRDYIFEDDAAAVIDAAMVRLAAHERGTCVMKVVGSMRAVSVGAILGEITRLRRHRGPFVLGQGNASGQAMDLRVRSQVWNDLDGFARTTLAEGLGRVFLARLAAEGRRSAV